MAILYGVGRPSMTTTIGGQERLLTFEPMSFQLATDTNVVKSKKYNSEGQIVDAGSAKQSISSTLTLGCEAITWMTMQIAFGELAAVSTNIELPDLKFAVLPLVGPFTINDAGIPATATKVTAAVYTDSKARSLERVAGAPGAGQFAVAAGVITVGPGLAGATIGYRVMKTIPTCESIGVDAAAVRFAKFRFDGILSTDDSTAVQRIEIPELSAEADPSISIESPTRFDLAYTLITQAGKPRPFYLYNVPV